MNEGQYDSKNVEHISIENIEVVSNGMDWKSRHLEAEKRKAEIRDRIHKQTEQGQKSAKDYFRPAKPTPSIYDSDLKRVAVYARVSTSSEEQISSMLFVSLGVRPIFVFCRGKIGSLLRLLRAPLNIPCPLRFQTGC